jgi:MFS family permease
MLIGFGNSSNQLSRYAAADMAPVARRASAIGLVVWSSTIGSVVGPWLVPVAGAMAVAVGLPLLAGPYLVPVLFVGTAAVTTLVFLRPDPYELADADSVVPAGEPVASDPVREILRRPGVGAAIAALIAGQFTMVVIMTMTPLHMIQHGHDLGAVGLVLSGHTLGMFALSPLSGRLTERWGSVRTILAGSLVLGVSAVMAAVAPPDGGALLLVALFLLGYGWNLGYVAGSTMLSERLELHERTRVQGIADALIWSASAAASLGSGIVMAAAGYTALAILAMGAVVVMAAVMARYRRRAARDVRTETADAAEMLDLAGTDGL